MRFLGGWVRCDQRGVSRPIQGQLFFFPVETAAENNNHKKEEQRTKQGDSVIVGARVCACARGNKGSITRLYIHSYTCTRDDNLSLVCVCVSARLRMGHLENHVSLSRQGKLIE